jgi:hypothetical protein
MLNNALFLRRQILALAAFALAGCVGSDDEGDEINSNDDTEEDPTDSGGSRWLDYRFIDVTRTNELAREDDEIPVVEGVDDVACPALDDDQFAGDEGFQTVADELSANPPIEWGHIRKSSPSAAQTTLRASRPGRYTSPSRRTRPTATAVSGSSRIS